MQCESCKFYVLDDYGYSNYTVEGTMQCCAKKVFVSFDRFYGNAPEQAKIPDPCPRYEFGEPIEMDVEMDGFNYLTDEQREIYNAV